MDYQKIADFIIVNIGSEKNISTIGHCATRLRAVVKDPNIVNLENLKKNPDLFSQMDNFKLS